MAPEDIAKYPVKTITQAQRDAYFKDGYLAIERAISPEWLARLRAAADGFVEQSRSVTEADKVFDIADAGKTLDTINEAAGTPGLTPHKLRHTFASIADDLVSGATARAMLNHAVGDVAQLHYIGISEAKLRAGWQAVADLIEAAK